MTSTLLIADTARGNTSTEFMYGLMLILVVGFLMAFVVLVIGKLVRPAVSHPEKDTPYECGEPPVGSSWVQYDLRFYTVALVFIVFDVEIVLLWPWAVVYKEIGLAAFWPFLIFFLLIAIPFIYEWKCGYLEWVRGSGGQADEPPVTSTESRRLSATAKAMS